MPITPRPADYGLVTHRRRIGGRQVTWLERTPQGVHDALPPLVIVPGMGMTWRPFRWFLRLQPADRRILVVHAPGAQGSDPLPGAMDSGAQARHLALWWEALDLPPSVVLGHSLGAVTVARLAAYEPDRVVAALLVSPSPDERWSTVLPHVGAFVRGLIHERGRTVPTAVLDYLRVHPRVLLGLPHTVGVSAADVVRDVRAPVTVVRGSDDLVCTEPWAGDLARQAATGRSVTVPRGAHGLPQDQPAALVLLLQEQPVAETDSSVPRPPDADWPTTGDRSERPVVH